MGILDMLVNDLNENLSEEEKQNGGKWERLHSPQYQIVQTENGVFKNPVKVATPETETD